MSLQSSEARSGRFPSQQRLQLSAAAVLIALASWSAAAVAQVQSASVARYELVIKAQSLASALAELRNSTKAQIVYVPAQIAGLQAPALSGSYTVTEALEKLLARTNLIIRTDGNGLIVIRTAEPVPEAGPRSQSDIVTLDTIVVTANKREENARDVGASLTALSGSELDRLGAKTIRDYAALVPGLSFVSVQPGMGQLTLRGVTTGVKQSGATVGTYIDDIPFTPFSRTASGTSVVPDVDTFDVQRIEVLRGPQGTLYGAGAMGGLLKYVTTPPELKQTEARIDVEANSTSGGDEGHAIKGMVNVPLSDTLALRVSGYSREVAGFIDNVGTGKSNENRATLEGARLALLYRPNALVQIKFSALSQHNDVHGTPAVDLSFTTAQPLYGDLKQSRAFEERTEQHYKIYNLQGTADLGWATALSSTSYSDIDISSRGDMTATYGALMKQYAALLGSVQTSTPLVDVKAAIGGRKWTQEFRLTSHSNQQLEWLVGAYYTHEDTDVAQSINGYAVGANKLPALLQTPLSLTVPSSYEEGAVFGNVDYYFSKQVDLSVGMRLSHNRQSGEQASFGLLNNTQAPTKQTLYASSSADTSRTYHIAPRWKPSEDLVIYASAGSGYRPGGPNVLPATSTAPTSYQPDTLWSYEAGFKSLFLRKRLSLDVSAFRINWSDIQLSSTVGGLQFLANGGKASSRGLEFALGYRPVAALKLGLSGSYTNAQLDSDAAGVGGLRGDALPTIARWSGSFLADYSFTLDSAWSGSLGMTVAHVGKRNSSFLGSKTNPNMLMPAYDTLNLRAALSNGSWEFGLFIDNVLDKRAISSIDTSAVSAGGAAKATVLTPRTLSLRVSALF